MGAVEIIIIIVGIIVFIASFVIPEKKGALSEDAVKLTQETVQKMVDEEMKTVQSTIEDKVEETVSYQVEKTERALERLSNEKIMAVDEYSETVLQQINKTHEEVVFLYDMLNDKHTNLKDVVAKAEEAAKTVQEVVQKADAVSTIPQMNIGNDDIRHNGMPESEPEEASMRSGTERFSPFVIEKVVPEAIDASTKSATKTAAKTAGAASRTSNRTSAGTSNRRKTATGKNVKADQKDIIVSTADIERGQEPKSNNDLILELHEQGRSNMAIAKELGLGMGEVKLVIDLYTGGK